MRLSKKGQGATEYLLMLAAVLVIVAIAVYYVTSTGGYPAVAVTAVKSGDTIRINVDTGSIPLGDWQYIVSTTQGSDNWTDGTVELKAPYVVLDNACTTGNYYVSLKHTPSGHIYFSDRTITI